MHVESFSGNFVKWTGRRWGEDWSKNGKRLHPVKGYTSRNNLGDTVRLDGLPKFQDMHPNLGCNKSISSQSGKSSVSPFSQLGMTWKWYSKVLLVVLQYRRWTMQVILSVEPWFSSISWGSVGKSREVNFSKRWVQVESWKVSPRRGWWVQK